jgi:hypothetical protein
VLAIAVCGSPAFADPATSITQYGITWTFDKAYETGQFESGDPWVVGPVTITNVSPEPTGTRNGSCLDPQPNKQGYDDRGGEFAPDDQVSFPATLTPDQSLVSSISKPEGAEIKNVGCLDAQAVLTVVAAPQPPGTLRPSYAGTYKRYFNTSEILWDLLPKLPAPAQPKSPTAPSSCKRPIARASITSARGPSRTAAPSRTGTTARARTPVTAARSRPTSARPRSISCSTPRSART